MRRLILFLSFLASLLVADPILAQTIVTKNQQTIMADVAPVTWDSTTNGGVDVPLSASSGATGTLEVSTDGAGCTTLWMDPSGTITAGQISFDGLPRNGTDWVQLSGSNGDETFVQSDLTPATTAYNGQYAGWRFPTHGFAKLRIRLAQHITGSGHISVWGSSTSEGCTPFLIARQGDPTRLQMTAHGQIANDSADTSTDFPLKIGGEAFLTAGESIGTLDSLPNVSASGNRAQSIYSPYGELAVVTRDKLKKGTITANGQTITTPLEGTGATIINVSGTWTGTLSFEESLDQSTWSPAVAVETATFTYATAFSTTVNGTWQLILQQGYRYFRVRASTAWTGTTTVILSSSMQPGISGLGFVEGSFGNGAADGSSRPVKIGGRANTGVPTPVADAQRVNAAYDIYGVPFTVSDHPNRINCSADNIAATLTELSTGNCKATDIAATESIYITDVVAQSTTGTAGQFLLRSGTGTNCGTGTTSVLPAAATVVRLAAPANTVEPLHLHFNEPIKVTADQGLCVIGIATNTTTIQVLGFKR